LFQSQWPDAKPEKLRQPAHINEWLTSPGLQPPK
jgi:hypothetical protein